MARPIAVQFGAGGIGRGFLGQLFSEAGYAVTFIDVRPELIAELNRRGEYPLRLVSANEERRIRVAPVNAIDGHDEAEVARAVSRASIIATAVGPAALEGLAGALAEGLALRTEPVNLLICENMPDPAGTLETLLVAHGADLAGAIGERIGLVPCVIGRMVPLPRPDADPLEVVAEPYARLPVDADRIVGDPPPIAGLEPKRRFASYVRLKLFVHNGGHAAAAYCGWLRGHRFIHDAIADPGVEAEAAGAMEEGCESLARCDGMDRAELAASREDLLARFRSPFLSDTVERVGRDPIRKLGPGDRLIGAASTALAAGVVPIHLARAIAAALRFRPAGDPSAERLQARIAERGWEAALIEISGLSPDDPLLELIRRVP